MLRPSSALLSIILPAIMSKGFLPLVIDTGKKTKSVAASPTWTVGRLHEHVAKVMSATVDEFYLLAHGKRMDDMDQILSSYRLQPNATIIYFERNHGGSLKPLLGYITLTDEPCEITYDDDPQEKRAIMPCGCVLAADTVKASATDTLSRGDYIFKCPNCGRAWDFFLVDHVLSAKLSADERKETARKVDANYMEKPEQDIRQCGICKTYGMRDFSSSTWYANRNRVRCNNCSRERGGNVDICWICGLEWKGNSLCGNQLCVQMKAERLKALAACETKAIGSVPGCPDTRACPQCSTFITHRDGCKHMDCKRCGCGFCFVCLKTKDASGQWQCGSYSAMCPVAPCRTTLP